VFRKCRWFSESYLFLVLVPSFHPFFYRAHRRDRFSHPGFWTFLFFSCRRLPSNSPPYSFSLPRSFPFLEARPIPATRPPQIDCRALRYFHAAVCIPLLQAGVFFLRVARTSTCRMPLVFPVFLPPSRFRKLSHRRNCEAVVYLTIFSLPETRRHPQRRPSQNLGPPCRPTTARTSISVSMWTPVVSPYAPLSTPSVS